MHWGTVMVRPVLLLWVVFQGSHEMPVMLNKPLLPVFLTTITPDQLNYSRGSVTCSWRQHTHNSKHEYYKHQIYWSQKAAQSFAGCDEDLAPQLTQWRGGESGSRSLTTRGGARDRCYCTKTLGLLQGSVLKVRNLNLYMPTTVTAFIKNKAWNIHIPYWNLKWFTEEFYKDSQTTQIKKGVKETFLFWRSS